MPINTENGKINISGMKYRREKSCTLQGHPAGGPMPPASKG